ncbi:MAG: hypothetical protein ACD_44C00084G0001 [uncultured bacterium]|nr:MAG: hypothetical protein ACD_44C00084G0001 [uncultured bacterium]
MPHPLFNTPCYSALLIQAQALSHQTILDLFSQDLERSHCFSIENEGLIFDFSKNLIDKKTLNLLLELTELVELKQGITQLFSGEKINSTEQRAVLHTALRDQTKQSLSLHGSDISASITGMQKKINEICQKIQDQAWLGFSKKPITNIVNIGIGGSDLGPKMVVDALTPYHLSGRRCHFVSNLDISHISDLLSTLSAGTTLFIVTSKTFSTAETLSNANFAKQWLLQQGATQETLASHFIAVTSCPEKAIAFGLHPEHILTFSDWVGGRFSLWSAVGLPIALAIGMPAFYALLSGAHQMDQHFYTQTFEKNIPILLALMSFWYTQFFNSKTQAILPYDYRLKHFPAYLQQLEMESNGKSVQCNNEKIDYPTCPIIWGDIGTNSQHSFHQLLHQGTHFNPIDFIVTLNPHHEHLHSHKQLLANCFAQSQALLQGCTEQQALERLLKQGYSEKEATQLAPHLVMPGNRPHNLISLHKLTPSHLGALIAAYEHKVFVLGRLWNINSFDQWGVELGKILANDILPTL